MPCSGSHSWFMPDRTQIQDICGPGSGLHPGLCLSCTIPDDSLASTTAGQLDTGTGPGAEQLLFCRKALIGSLWQSEEGLDYVAPLAFLASSLIRKSPDFLQFLL